MDEDQLEILDKYVDTKISVAFANMLGNTPAAIAAVKQAERLLQKLKAAETPHEQS